MVYYVNIQIKILIKINYAYNIMINILKKNVSIFFL